MSVLPLSAIPEIQGASRGIVKSNDLLLHLCPKERTQTDKDRMKECRNVFVILWAQVRTGYILTKVVSKCLFHRVLMMV